MECVEYIDWFFTVFYKVFHTRIKFAQVLNGSELYLMFDLVLFLNAISVEKKVWQT